MSSKDIPPGGLPTPGHPLELSSSMGPSQGACYWGFQEKRWLCHREPSGLAVWTISRVVERSHSCSKVTDRPTLSHGPSVLPQRALPRGSPLVFGSKLELTNFLVTPLGKRVYRCTKNQPPKWPVQNIAPMFLQATSWKPNMENLWAEDQQRFEDYARQLREEVLWKGDQEIEEAKEKYLTHFKMDWH